MYLNRRVFVMIKPGLLFCLKIQSFYWRQGLASGGGMVGGTGGG